ncbi:MAG: ribosome small subunit-dependent GTPase A [Vallitaleaceae bacterium]|jgi:ribosome biogenesis GTPase|nr:ribosome small subunit-dependent GTPase A [Vallitaleaceae bacterium]
MDGKIVKGIGGFYYVNVPGVGVYECRARGIFRNEKITPLIGDNVKIDILDQVHMKGNLVEIYERRNALKRPTVANVDQIMVVFSINDPKPNLNLLDRFLVMIEREGIKGVVCFNKTDRSSIEEIEILKQSYALTGYDVFLTSALDEEGIGPLEDILKNKTTAFAGPSGVGKSSILNLIQTVVALEIGEISQKIKRGKHTTRHAELICFHKDSYVVDTPGFSSLDIDRIDADELRRYFVEFEPLRDYCKYQTCAHINEPHCAVKEALSKGEIAKSRYMNYVTIYNELKDIKRY